MHLISTSKITVLSDFADLETKSTFVHANGETSDFQFNQRRLFVEVDKKAGLAVMRIKEKEDKAPEIQRVRKLTIDNAFCVCCAKQSTEEIAVGQSTGYVKLYNYRTAQLIHRFPADSSRSAILYVDYNANDEYIAAVTESGSTNIYGTKTQRKIDTIHIDEQSSLARFHPTKRLQLGVASYKGAVTVYDIQSKRKTFHVTDAHDAPCRDLSMCSSQPSLLVSVGYDCKINIFDIRRQRGQPSTDRLKYTTPLSTVALSECGMYFCAGNLKGELIAYDMRSTKQPLAVRKVHEGGVVRVAFVPVPNDEQQSSSFSSAHNVTMDAGLPTVKPASSDELRKSIAANLLSTQLQLDSINSGVMATPTASTMTLRPHRDSFCDFLDGQHAPKPVDRMSTRLSMNRRDSFDWETLGERKRSSNDDQSKLLESPVPESLQQTLSGPLRDRSNVSGEIKLKQIAETDEHLAEEQQSVNSSSSSSDKENPQMVDQELQRRLRMLSASRNSTPHHPTVQSSSSQLKPQQLLAQTSSGLSAASSQQLLDVSKELNNLRDFVDQRFEHLEKEMKVIGEQNKWHIFTQVANYFNHQVDSTQQIRNALAILIHGDPFVNEFSRLQYENAKLKAQVAQLREKSEPK
ncbi:protein NEDD1 [Drosophila tropicalis]|uniref:protein NEDD1 n=1 Tax=Drosophila tropicalis TaxID=46794 RepID=UPI0035ABF824